MHPWRDDPDRRCLPFAEWPAADRTAWSSLTTPAGPLDEPGAGSHWHAVTEARARTIYGRWLGYIAREWPQWLALGPAERIQESSVRGFVAHLDSLNLAPLTISTYLARLLQVARGLALDTDWDWLDGVARRLDRRGGRERRRAIPVRSSRELFDAGVDLMHAAEVARPVRPWDRHAWFRDGLTVALLALRPIRHKNLAAITLDRHLVVDGDGYRLVFAADEMKTGRAFDQPLPEELTSYLQRYLNHHRPALLAGGTTAALWVSYQGRALSYMGVAERVKAATRRMLGEAVPPHAFRHCAATTIALEAPDEVWCAQGVLHHSQHRTGERHYQMAASVTAARRYQAVLRSRRRK